VSISKKLATPYLGVRWGFEITSKNSGEYIPGNIMVLKSVVNKNITK
jgi:hypothetical protein